MGAAWGRKQGAGVTGCRGSEGRGHLVCLDAGRSCGRRIYGSWVLGGTGEKDPESVGGVRVPTGPWASEVLGRGAEVSECP